MPEFKAGAKGEAMNCRLVSVTTILGMLSLCIVGCGTGQQTGTIATTSTQPPQHEVTTSSAVDASTAPTVVQAGIPATDLRWPSVGPSGGEVFSTLASLVPQLPVYLPKALPEGFTVASSWVISRADGSPLTNPTTWNESMGAGAGYGLAFTDGNFDIVLWVNPAADHGESVQFAPVEAYLDGIQFSRLVGEPIVVVIDADGIRIEVHGSSLEGFSQVLELANSLELVISQ